MRIGIRRPAWNRPSRTLRWSVCSALVAGQAASAAVASQPMRLLTAEEPHMGLVVRISAYFPSGSKPPEVFRAAFERVAVLAAKFSTYQANSELRRLEGVAWREPVRVSDEFVFLLGHALQVARDSDGGFDPTIGSVTRLLRAGRWGRRGPPDHLLRQAWDRTGWKQIDLRPASRTVSFTRRGVQLDLGGIAKGYIADEALAELRRAEIYQALVAVAGDIAVGDPPPDARGWTIGLDGRGPRGTVERKLLLSNCGVSTSGGRERHFRTGDRRCSHILDRSTVGCADPEHAVSVVARSAMEADSVATALVALGQERAEEFLERRPAATVYWARPAHHRMSEERHGHTPMQRGLDNGSDRGSPSPPLQIPTDGDGTGSAARPVFLDGAPGYLSEDERP